MSDGPFQERKPARQVAAGDGLHRAQRDRDGVADTRGYRKSRERGVDVGVAARRNDFVETLKRQLGLMLTPG
ncbi:MAG TPA: hypothetical protein VN224_12165 [Xanthomonadales bacterium]|nr:hypothetical protein [Xanthomonadales bacterium]